MAENSSSPSPLDAALAPVIAEIYEAALRPARWSVVLERLVEQFQGKGAILRTFEATPETAGLWFACRIEPWALEEYVRYFQPRDVWEGRARERGLMRAGEVFSGDMLLSREEFHGTEFYRDFLSRQDIRELLAFVMHDGATPPMPLTVLSIFRGHQEPLFGEAEVQLGRQLIPHLSRAAELNFQFAEMRHRAAVHSAALEQFALAIAYFDRSGKMLNANRAANALFGASDGIQIQGNRLAATLIDEDRQLQQLLSGDAQAKGGEPDVVRIARPSGKLPYVAVYIALPPDPLDPPDARRAHSALLLRDPATAAELDLDALTRIYGLTPAERRLVQVLVDHGSAKEIFRTTDLNENTVRSQLKAVLRKTGTRAQAELVRLALTVALPRRA